MNLCYLATTIFYEVIDIKLSLIALICLVATSAFAVNFNTELDQEISRLQAIRSATSGDLNAPKNCKRKYANLFNKRVIKISYGFGYGDSSPGDLIWDHYSYNAFMRKIKMPCPYGVTLCGFTASKKDPNLLRKIVSAPTDENNYMIELRITKSSIGAKHSENMSIPFNIMRQMTSCVAATNKFMKEIEDGADVVIYNGHSRNGGGPDFCPPVRKEDAHVNYDYYRSKRPGITLMTEAMKKAVDSGKPNKVVGMFSCASQLHFYNRLMAVNNKAGYILTSRNATFTEVTLDSFAALDGILAQRCEDGFEESFAYRNRALWRNMF